ncbi:hypothetical protein ANCCAN_25693 [Ancylostoma caninum]|uniref:Uncharacterized protein n=1 Tax=Ancylostoma caninum TaxID=29170 RepID=A0A368F8Y3_ANCCA|nr:hypothetical protein ANCCAN_25693 [Ancylostoma caninum]
MFTKAKNVSAYPRSNALIKDDLKEKPNRDHITYFTLYVFSSSPLFCKIVWSLIHRSIVLDYKLIVYFLVLGEDPYIRLQMKDDAELRLRSDHISQLMSSISSAAFPKKYVTIAPSTSMESSSSENDDTQFYDQYPVLLVPSTLTTKRNLAEGNYSLRFCDDLLALIHGNIQVQHFPYHDILWAAVGENSLGIAVENCGVYEFICDQPLLIIDHMRNYIRFKNSFPAVRLNTKRKYNRFYHQAREVTTSASDLRLPVPPKCLNGSEQKKDSERWKDQPIQESCYDDVVEQPQCASAEVSFIILTVVFPPK